MDPKQNERPSGAAGVTRRRLGLAVLLLAVSAGRLAAADPPKDAHKPGSDSKAARASAAFFSGSSVPELRIEVAPEELKKLRAQNRVYVRCKLTETLVTGDQKQTASYADVGVKLKGAAGSFRGLDDRPALTLNLDKFRDGQSYHGLDKFHLNNSVQDGTLLHEVVSAHLFLGAGVPAARATHARVWLNGRDLGLYVLKEGFDPAFLRRHFADATGNLYDGGFCREIDQPLEKDCGKGADDRSDLKALRAACAVADVARRQAALEKALDVDRFLAFAAVEMMACHWDGYCRNRNNYRLYFDPADGKAQFFPHGMDQMFGDPNFPLFDVGGVVGSAVLGVPEFRRRYRARVEALLPLFDPEKLHPVVDGVSRRLKPTLEAMGKGQARGHLAGAEGFKGQLTRRYQALGKALKLHVEPAVVRFDDKGEAPLAGWEPRKETDDASHAQGEVPGAKKALVLKVGPGKRCIASWRREVVLPRGRYEFQARVKSVGVVPLADQKSGVAAGLRISGGTRTNTLAGDSDWQTLTHTIEVAQDGQTVVLVAELRATAGTALFDASSLKLVRAKW